ncbi:MAG: hypothetical protein JWP80_3107 [Pseudomonas sp.]|nr:hypothetical protein [Pseudomonas sp.]
MDDDINKSPETGSDAETGLSRQRRSLSSGIRFIPRDRGPSVRIEDNDPSTSQSLPVMTPEQEAARRKLGLELDEANREALDAMRRRWEQAGDEGFSVTIDEEVDPDNLPPDLLVEEYFNGQSVRMETPEAYAKHLIKEYARSEWSLDLDPDETLITTLYIESQGASAPYRANVAYQMTLTQAMLSNWQQSGSGDWFDHLGHLAAYREGGYSINLTRQAITKQDCVAYEAVYRKTTPQRYDASTHLKIQAARFKQFVWQADLQPHYFDYLDRFWARHSLGYNLLIKGGLLRAAYIQARERSLSQDDKSLVLEALGLSHSQEWENLRFLDFRDAPLRQSMGFCQLIIHGYIATDIIVLNDYGTGRLLMYIPGNSSPWHAFESQIAAKDWIGTVCKDLAKRRALEGHFSAVDDGDGLFFSGVQTALEGMAIYPRTLSAATGSWAPRNTVAFSQPIMPWPFSHFRDNAKNRYQSDARQIIHTQSDYRKEVFRHGLTNAVTATGLIAMVVPELLPVIVGLSLGLVGVGVDQAIEGRTLEEREEGLARVAFGVMNALPLAAEVVEEGYAVIREVTGGKEVGEGAGREWLMTDEQRAADEASDVSDTKDSQEKRQLDDEWHNAKANADDWQAIARYEAQTPLERSQARVLVPEPPALHSLKPAMRRLLRRLESPQSLEELQPTTTRGAGTIYSRDDTSPQFIQLHDKVYHIKWVRSEGQFRIYSEFDPSLPGPFIQKLKSGEWDLDLKPGLRGGESYDGSVENPIFGQVTRNRNADIPVVLQRDIPKIQVELPMDGIERTDDQYFIMLNGKRTSVYFDADADVACWKTSPIDYVWRDGAGEWRGGDAAAYKRVEAKLPRSVDTYVYTFARLPRLPESPTPIAREVHHIWMGSRLPGDGLLANIEKNALKSPDLKFTLHIDIGKETALSELTSRFAELPNVHISPLKDEPFYEGFLKSRNAELFDYFRHGDYQNLAAASDVLRYRLIYEYGGIYMDCDDTLLRSFAGIDLNAGPNDVLMGNEVHADSFGYVGPNTSHFASHPRNPVLKQLLDEIRVRYQKTDPAFFKTPRPHIDTSTEALRVATREQMRPYMIKIFELTGPRVFSDVISELRPDYFELLARTEKMQGSSVVASAYTEQFEAVRDFYFPFKRKAPIFAGSANEW